MQGREDGGLDQAWGSGSDEKWPDSGYLQVKLVGCAVGQEVGKMVCGGMSREGKEQILGVWVWTLYFRDVSGHPNSEDTLQVKDMGRRGILVALKDVIFGDQRENMLPIEKVV